MTHRALWLALAASMLAACSSTASLTDAKLSQASKQGDGRAQYELAKRLAHLGNTHASYQLGLMCQEQHQGKLVNECLDWFE